jgi:hypothetical protein
MATEDDVRRIALSLPGAYEQQSYDARPSWRTKPRMFTVMADDPEVVVVWVDSVEEKEALLAAEPGTFATTPHYDGHPVVLVRLAAVEVDELAELIEDSWRLRAPRSLTARRSSGQEPKAP